MLVQAIEMAGRTPGDDIAIAMDVASTEFYEFNSELPYRASITSTYAAALAKALEVNRVLTTLDLNGNNLTNFGEDMTGIYAITDALKGNGVLKKLDIQDNS